MPSLELQKQMVIDKGKDLPLKMRLKSVLLDVATWILWIYIITFAVRYAKSIFTQPVLETFYFLEVVSLMFGTALVLVLLTYLWSLFTVERATKGKS